ncbi:hypothetical protein [Fictibacillus sp. S7]|uniref:hypothetical protein n=1 Tax=Fictibacillus sp. S7 TaxID=2212476 RepID=UPI0019D71245|nr:hypothetical protein [Fictibacillus sp. S7]
MKKFALPIGLSFFLALWDVAGPLLAVRHEILAVNREILAVQHNLVAAQLDLLAVRQRILAYHDIFIKRYTAPTAKQTRRAW